MLDTCHRFPEWTPEDARQNPLLTMATTFAYVGGGAMGYIVYANWIGLHRWGLTGHQNIGAIRDYAFKHDAIDYLPDAPETGSADYDNLSRRCGGTLVWAQSFCLL